MHPPLAQSLTVSLFPALHLPHHPVQSLILVDEPWYNEPGYEQRADSANSDRYSAGLM